MKIDLLEMVNEILREKHGRGIRSTQVLALIEALQRLADEVEDE